MGKDFQFVVLQVLQVSRGTRASCLGLVMPSRDRHRGGGGRVSWRAGSRRSDRLTAGGEREGPVPVKVVKIWDTRMECHHARAHFVHLPLAL